MSNLQITGEKLILVEGEDDKLFLTAFAQKNMVSDIQIYAVDGTSNFKKKLKSISQMSDFSIVRKLAIIRDADDNPTGAFQSICSALAGANNTIAKIPIPTAAYQVVKGTAQQPDTLVFLMPGKGKCGALEDMLLAVLKNRPSHDCVERFMSCVEDKIDESELQKFKKLLPKSKVQAHISAFPKNFKHIGQAVMAGVFDFNAPEFIELTEIIEFFND